MRLLVIEASATLVTNLVKRSRSRAFAFQPFRRVAGRYEDPRQGRYVLGFSSSGSLAIALATLRASSLVRYSGIIGTRWSSLQ